MVCLLSCFRAPDNRGHANARARAHDNATSAERALARDSAEIYRVVEGLESGLRAMHNHAAPARPPKRQLPRWLSWVQFKGYERR